MKSLIIPVQLILLAVCAITLLGVEVYIMMVLVNDVFYVTGCGSEVGGWSRTSSSVVMASQGYSSDETSADRNVEIWKIKKLIKSFEMARG